MDLPLSGAIGIGVSPVRNMEEWGRIKPRVLHHVHVQQNVPLMEISSQIFVVPEVTKPLEERLSLEGVTFFFFY